MEFNLKANKVWKLKMLFIKQHCLVLNIKRTQKKSQILNI